MTPDEQIAATERLLKWFDGEKISPQDCVRVMANAIVAINFALGKEHNKSLSYTLKGCEISCTMIRDRARALAKSMRGR